MGEDVKAKFAEWNYRFNPWCTRRAAEELAAYAHAQAERNAELHDLADRLEALEADARARR